MKIPQLRVLVCSFCGRRCIYCRSTGEGWPCNSPFRFINIEDALYVCALYKSHGGTDVKITGGDPVFYPQLVPFVRRLKDEVGISKIELITRSPLIADKIEELIAVGLDVLNFSLDTVNEKMYAAVTGADDYERLIEAIKVCSMLIPCKINAVIMKDINDNQINELIAFCEANSIKQLKLLDIIIDFQDDGAGNSQHIKELYGDISLRDMYVSLTPICELIKKKAVYEAEVFQGGLGHPMNQYTLPSGLIITVKNSENGAWYGDSCNACRYFPCHDALMALRLTPDNKLQHCLLNEDNSFSLEGVTSEEANRVFENSLKLYENARFVK